MAAQRSTAQGMGPSVDFARLEKIGRDLLLAIGEDPSREGLRDTPARWARWWREFIEYQPGNLGTAFEAITTDQLVAVTGIKVWTLCEHHLLPFWCTVSFGYIARDKVLGLSKFARIAHAEAHKLQIQERLVHTIADKVAELTGSPDVAVIGTGQHLCMVMRGVKTPGLMHSSVMRGRFRESGKVREEFLSFGARHATE